MTSADRRRLLFTLQQERRKGRQAWKQLCRIEATETASGRHSESRPVGVPPNATVQRVFRIRPPRPGDLGANN